MKTRTILATTVAVGAVAASTISGTASAAACDQGFLRAFVTATKTAQAGLAAEKWGSATAHAEFQQAWTTLRVGPIPCNSFLRVARQHELRTFQDFDNELDQLTKGNTDQANWFGEAAIRENDLAGAALVQARGQLQG